VDEYGRLIAAWQQAPKDEKLKRTEKTKKKKNSFRTKETKRNFLLPFLNVSFDDVI
jgi:hypothetical protein